MPAPGLILATDLDGTFLGGSSDDRVALYRELDSRDDVILIYVTGRDPDFLASLREVEQIPAPRYVVGDVGTSVLDGPTLQPISALEAPIADRWQDAGARVSAVLQGAPGVVPQPGEFRHRASYYYDPRRPPHEAMEELRTAGFDVLLSADRYLDVLPRGVSKGPTLMSLLGALRLPTDRVLVAGDTLNDLSLFRTGLRGVAVGGSEPALLESLAQSPDGLPDVLRSEQAGAAGISHAIDHFGLHRRSTQGLQEQQ
jgi:hydroxymethylpyrimidine pyrophosphatase-like HAD family hydrolase